MGGGLGDHSTANMPANTRTSAVHSPGPGRSPRISMPENTPTTGTGNEDIDEIATGSVRASVNHAQCASVPARRMLYRIANHALAVMAAGSGHGAKNGAAMTSGSPPSSIIQPDIAF